MLVHYPYHTGACGPWIAALDDCSDESGSRERASRLMMMLSPCQEGVFPAGREQPSHLRGRQVRSGDDGPLVAAHRRVTQARGEASPRRPGNEVNDALLLASTLVMAVELELDLSAGPAGERAPGGGPLDPPLIRWDMPARLALHGAGVGDWHHRGLGLPGPAAAPLHP